MFRLAVLLSLALLLCILPGGYAGPACTKKYYKTVQCVQKCSTRWGYPGTMMGTNRWGVVMQKVDDSKDGWKTVIAEACGMASSKSKEVDEDDGNDDEDDSGVVGAVGSKPDNTSTEDDDDDDTEVTILATTSPSTSSTSTSTSTSKKSTPKTPNPPPAALQATSTPPPKKITPSPTKEKTTPATTPKSTPKATPKPDNDDNDNAGSSNQGGDIGEYLKNHNDFRARHGAASLTWSDNLARKAQQWANGCQFKHSGGSLGRFGENLAAGTGSSYGIANAIKSWTDESKDYDPNNPQFSHFTQVVWKSTKQVGCALRTCDGIFDAKFGPAKYYVCEYDPPGNIVGEFDQNVQA